MDRPIVTETHFPVVADCGQVDEKKEDQELDENVEFTNGQKTSIEPPDGGAWVKLNLGLYNSMVVNL